MTKHVGRTGTQRKPGPHSDPSERASGYPNDYRSCVAIFASHFGKRVLTSIECPRCGKDTPHDESTCVRCHQALSPDAIDAVEGLLTVAELQRILFVRAARLVCYGAMLPALSTGGKAYAMSK